MTLLSNISSIKRIFFSSIKYARHYGDVSYVQGQSPGKNLREYFYYIDHQGMVSVLEMLLKSIKLCNGSKDLRNLSLLI